MGEAKPQEVHWNPQLERILGSDGEQAQCYSWMHGRAEKKYSRYDHMVSIPVIVISTITAFLSASTGSVIPQTVETNVALGSMSMFVGILNTIGTKFGWAKRSEAHKIACVTYSKIHKMIQIELSLPLKERRPAGELLKSIREQMDRLAEISPQIPDDIIKAFNKKFEHTTPDISKPEITNGLDPIIPFHEIVVEKPDTTFKPTIVELPLNTTRKEIKIGLDV